MQLTGKESNGFIPGKALKNSLGLKVIDVKL